MERKSRDCLKISKVVPDSCANVPHLLQTAELASPGSQEEVKGEQHGQRIAKMVLGQRLEKDATIQDG